MNALVDVSQKKLKLAVCEFPACAPENSTGPTASGNTSTNITIGHFGAQHTAQNQHQHGNEIQGTYITPIEHAEQ
jgi:hypothetical protein